MKKLIITMMTIATLAGAFSAYADEGSITEKCGELTSELANQKLLGSLENQELKIARSVYIADKTPENKAKMYEALTKVNKIQVKAVDICVQQFANN